MATRTKKSSVKSYRVTVSRLIGYFGTITEMNASKKGIRNNSPGVKFSAAKKTPHGYAMLVTWIRKIRTDASASAVKAAVQQRVGDAKVVVTAMGKKRA